MPVALIVFLGIGLWGCHDPLVGTADFRRPPIPQASQGTWVAKFDTQSITDAELGQRFAEMNPYARARFQSVEQRREHLESMVRYELLAQEAVRRKLHQDPEVVEATRRAMVQLLLKRELEEGARITDREIADYYQAHRADYVKPAMVRLAHIAFGLDARAQAEAVLAEAKRLPPLDTGAFAKLARQHDTDERTRPLDGDMRFLSDEELVKLYGSEIGEAAARLERVGDVFPTLITTPKALHVLKLLGRQQPLNLSVEQAKTNITQILATSSKQARLRELLEQLKQDAQVTFNDSALSAMTVDPKEPAIPATGPAPGIIPSPTPTQ